MTPKVRRALIWSGLILLAFAGGSLLGRFATVGLTGRDHSLPDSSDVGNFWAEQDRSRTSQVAAPSKPVEHFINGIPESHDCDGCDASVARDKQIGAAIAAQMPPLLGEQGAPSGTADASPSIPTAP